MRIVKYKDIPNHKTCQQKKNKILKKVKVKLKLMLNVKLKLRCMQEIKFSFVLFYGRLLWLHLPVQNTETTHKV